MPITSIETGKCLIALLIGHAAQPSRIVGWLTPFYRLTAYPDVSRALAGCRARPPRLVVTSEQLLAANGYDFVRMLRLDSRLADIPVLMLVAREDSATLTRVVQCGADGHVVIACSQSTFLAAVSGLLNRRVEAEWKSLPALQRQALTGTLSLFNGIANGISNGEPIPYGTVSDACGPLIEAVASNDFRDILRGVRDHDNYSYAHSMRVATYLTLFGANLRLPKDEQLILACGGLLHDVGKMSIPHEVLNKSGPLTNAEFEVMRGHVNASMTYLQKCPDLPTGIITIAAQHHEKLDGTGYPEGLPGSKLNRLARIASIIDVFSALTDRRVYKPPMEAEAALNFMVSEMTSHLDVKLLGLFRQMLLDATRELAPAPAEVA